MNLWGWIKQQGEGYDIYCQSCDNQIGVLPERAPSRNSFPETHVTRGYISPLGEIYCGEICVSAALTKKTRISLAEGSGLENASLADWYGTTRKNKKNPRQIQKAIREGQLTHFSRLEKTALEDTASA